MPSTLLIGAGIAGLAAAHKLIEKGHTVTVLDKGRGVGGRMATRRIDRSRLDHGAQYFSVKTPGFQHFVEQLLIDGIAGVWPVDDPQEGHLQYIGRMGMSAIPKYLAQSVNVITNERVVRLEKCTREGNPGWRALTEAGSVYEADNLFITIPAPQALALLRDSQLAPDEVDWKALEAIQYSPCIAVMAVLNQPSLIPQPGAFRPEQGSVAWIADNYQKGISPDQHSVTIQATGEFSKAHFDNDPMAVGTMLLSEIEYLIPAGNVSTYQVHRWRYSLAEVRHPEPFLAARTQAPLLLGGDGFGTGNVEGAYLSGLAMAEALSR